MKCGAQFTSKLEGMIMDLTLATDTQKDFREHCLQLPDGRSTLGGMEFNVTVLTTGFWPSYQVNDANLCPEMQKATSVFHNFYNGKTQHRRLQWIHSLGQATVASKLNNRRHDLIESTITKKLLATLACSKYKILSKTGENLKGVDDTDTFTPNETFQCPHRKIKIP